MEFRRFVYATWIVVWMAAGCGGSGSSGFDAFGENVAIARALEADRCVERAGLTICPSGKGAVPRNRPGEPPIAVRVALDLTQPPGCALTAEADACVIEVPLIVTGLPAGGELRVATRVVDPIARWLLGSALAAPASQTRVTGEARFVLAPAPQLDATVEVQMAVLAFRDPAAAVAADLEELADAGADAAFVTPVFSIVIAASASPDPGLAGSGPMQ